MKTKEYPYYRIMRGLSGAGILVMVRVRVDRVSTENVKSHNFMVIHDFLLVATC